MGLTYAFLFTIPSGVHTPFIAPYWKRVVGMALLIFLGNLGGAIGNNIFIESQMPRYPLRYGFCLAIVAPAICSALVLKSSVMRWMKLIFGQGILRMSCWIWETSPSLSLCYLIELYTLSMAAQHRAFAKSIAINYDMVKST